jgi:hypothetical protein
MRRAASILIVTLATACGSSTPTPSASDATSVIPEASAEVSGPASAATSASVVPTPTPGADTVPRFSAGSLVVTNAPGLRVRSRPGTTSSVVTTLGVEADLLAVLGPVMVGGLGWYLVRDADDAEPGFTEGWVAAGFEPDPFLISAGTTPGENPVLGGFADIAAGEFGPLALPDAEITLRWIASTHEREVCNFSLDLTAGAGEPVRAVRTPVGAFPASGELPAQFFASNPALRDNVFALVESDCSWAIAFVRARPAGQAASSPS